MNPYRMLFACPVVRLWLAALVAALAAMALLASPVRT